MEFWNVIRRDETADASARIEGEFDDCYMFLLCILPVCGKLMAFWLALTAVICHERLRTWAEWSQIRMCLYSKSLFTK